MAQLAEKEAIKYDKMARDSEIARKMKEENARAAELEKVRSVEQYEAEVRYQQELERQLEVSSFATVERCVGGKSVGSVRHCDIVVCLVHRNRNKKSRSNKRTKSRSKRSSWLMRLFAKSTKKINGSLQSQHIV